MSVQAIGAFIVHEQDHSSKISGPAPVVHRDSITTSPPKDYELDELQWGKKLNGPQKEAFRDSSPLGRSIPLTPDDLEHSRPPTPNRERAVDAMVLSFSNPPRNRWRLAAASVMFFLMGVNDAATGALIPYVEKQYNIGYAIVSLIFITNALGFISSTPVTQILEARVGRARSYLIATASMAIGYTAVVCTPPFPVVVLSFWFLGFGMGLFLAMTNAFIVNLLNGTVILGFCHGLYGVTTVLPRISFQRLMDHSWGASCLL
jgi:fucose permease